MKKIVILGGSGAYTPALSRALAIRADALPELDVVLVGLDAHRTALVAGACRRFAESRGIRHRYAATTNVEESLEGAEIVVNQVRPGGLVGRASDERFPLEFGIAGDETIGPGGLASGIRGAAVVRDLVEKTLRTAPKAWFIQLTNPMSILLSVLGHSAGPRVFGLCELPGETLRRALKLIDLDVGAVDVDYAGLNHRGWFHRVEHAGRSLLPDIFCAIEASPDAGFFKVSVSRMRECGALPLPYLALELDAENSVAKQRSALRTRAEELREGGARLMNAYASGGSELPDELSTRSTPWYDQALVPSLIALLGGEPAELYVSEKNRGFHDWLPDEAVVEKRSLVDDTGVHPIGLRAPVPKWLEEKIKVAERFEALAARCAEEPTLESVGRALSAMNLPIPRDARSSLARRVLEVAR